MRAEGRNQAKPAPPQQLLPGGGGGGGGGKPFHLLEGSSPGSSMAPPTFPAGLWRSVTSSETTFPTALGRLLPGLSHNRPINVAFFFLLARYHYLMSQYFSGCFFFGLAHEGLSLYVLFPVRPRDTGELGKCLLNE